MARLVLKHANFRRSGMEVALVFYHERLLSLWWRGPQWDAKDVWLPPGWAGAWTAVFLKKLVAQFREQGFRFAKVTGLDGEVLAAREPDYRPFGFQAPGAGGAELDCLL